MSDSPRQVPGYRVEAELARGGQGVVLRAVHERLRRPVALKLLTGVDSADRARFMREGRLLSGLRHPGLPTVHDLGVTPQGLPYLAMELIEGRDLRQHVAQQGIPAVAWSAGVTARLARILASCHAAGVVHRDLKPHNVMLDREDSVMLVDFGLARATPAGLRSSRGALDLAELTATGEIVGTPAYLSPEQVDQRFGEVGPATDLYGLGGVLFFLLTGQAPVRKSSVMGVLTAVIADPAPDPRQHDPELPAGLAELVQRLLAKRPEERPESAASVAATLEAWATRSAAEPHRRPPGGGRLIVAGLLAIFAAGAAVSAALASRGGPDATGVTPSATPPPRAGGAGGEPSQPGRWRSTVDATVGLPEAEAWAELERLLEQRSLPATARLLARLELAARRADEARLRALLDEPGVADVADAVSYRLLLFRFERDDVVGLREALRSVVPLASGAARLEAEATLCWVLGMHPLALARSRETLGAEPARPRAQVLRAAAGARLLLCGRQVEGLDPTISARGLLEAALEAVPGDTLLLSELAREARLRGDHRGAAEHLLAATGSAPAVPPPAWLGRLAVDEVLAGHDPQDVLERRPGLRHPRATRETRGWRGVVRLAAGQPGWREDLQEWIRASPLEAMGTLLSELPRELCRPVLDSGLVAVTHAAPLAGVNQRVARLSEPAQEAGRAALIAAVCGLGWAEVRARLERARRAAPEDPEVPLLLTELARGRGANVQALAGLERALALGADPLRVDWGVVSLPLDAQSVGNGDHLALQGLQLRERGTRLGVLARLASAVCYADVGPAALDALDLDLERNALGGWQGFPGDHEVLQTTRELRLCVVDPARRADLEQRVRQRAERVELELGRRDLRLAGLVGALDFNAVKGGADPWPLVAAGLDTGRIGFLSDFYFSPGWAIATASKSPDGRLIARLMLENTGQLRRGDPDLADLLAQVQDPGRRRLPEPAPLGRDPQLARCFVPPPALQRRRLALLEYEDARSVLAANGRLASPARENDGLDELREELALARVDLELRRGRWRSVERLVAERPWRTALLGEVLEIRGEALMARAFFELADTRDELRALEAEAERTGLPATKSHLAALRQSQRGLRWLALESCRRALSLEPHRPRTLAVLAKLQLDTAYGEGLQRALEAVAAGPDDLEALRWAVARAGAEAGLNEEAWQTAAELAERVRLLAPEPSQEAARAALLQVRTSPPGPEAEQQARRHLQRLESRVGKEVTQQHSFALLARAAGDPRAKRLLLEARATHPFRLVRVSSECRLVDDEWLFEAGGRPPRFGERFRELIERRAACCQGRARLAMKRVLRFALEGAFWPTLREHLRVVAGLATGPAWRLEAARLALGSLAARDAQQYLLDLEGVDPARLAYLRAAALSGGVDRPLASPQLWQAVVRDHPGTSAARLAAVVLSCGSDPPPRLQSVVEEALADPGTMELDPLPVLRARVQLALAANNSLVANALGTELSQQWGWLAPFDRRIALLLNHLALGLAACGDLQPLARDALRRERRVLPGMDARLLLAQVRSAVVYAKATKDLASLRQAAEDLGEVLREAKLRDPQAALTYVVESRLAIALGERQAAVGACREFLTRAPRGVPIPAALRGLFVARFGPGAAVELDALERE